MATFTYSNTLFEHGRSVIITAPDGKQITSLFYQQLDALDFVQTKYFSPFASEHRLTQLEAGDYSALIKYDDSTQEQVQFAGQAVPTQPKIEKVASTETTCRVLVSRLDASAQAYSAGMKAVFYLVAGPLIEEVEVVLASEMHIGGKWQIDLVRPQSFPTDGLYQSVDINASVTSDLLTPGELPMRSLPSTAITVDMNNVPNDPIVLAQLTNGGAIGKGEEVAFAVQAPVDAQPELWASDDYKLVFKASWLTLHSLPVDVPESYRAYSPLDYPAENITNPHLTWPHRLSTMNSSLGYSPFRPSTENFAALNYWVQLKTSEMEDAVRVMGVVVAGSGAADNRYNSTVAIKYSSTGTSDSDFSDINGNSIFDANIDTTSQKNIVFSTPVNAKYIRVYPTAENGALRVSLLLDSLLSHEQLFEKAIESGQTEDIILTRTELLAVAGISLGSRLDISVKAQNIHGSTAYSDVSSVSIVAPAAEGAALAAPTFEITKFHSSSVKGIMETSVDLLSIANVKTVTDFPSSSTHMYTLVESATGRELESIGNMGVFEGAKSDKPLVADFIPALPVYESDQIAISAGNQSTLPIAFELWGQSKTASLLIDNVGGYSHLGDATTTIEVINQFPAISRYIGGGFALGIPAVKFTTDADTVVAFGAANPYKFMIAQINDDSIHAQYPNDLGKYLMVDLDWQANHTGDDYGVVAREVYSVHRENHTGKITMISDPALIQRILTSNWGINSPMNSVRLPQMTVASDLGSASLTRDTTVAADGSLPHLGAFTPYETDFNLALRPEEAISGISMSSGDQTVSVSYSPTTELLGSTFIRYEALFEGLDVNDVVQYSHTVSSTDRAVGTLSKDLSQVENGYSWRATVKMVVQHKVSPTDAQPATQETNPSISGFSVPRGEVILDSITKQGTTLTATVRANGNSFIQLQGLLLDNTPSQADQIYWSVGVNSNAHNRYDMSVARYIHNGSLSEGNIAKHIAAIYRGESVDSMAVGTLHTDISFP